MITTLEYFYIAIDRDFKGKDGGAGYNRLSLFKIPNYKLAKFYIEKTLGFIFENEYPTMRAWYSEGECIIDYPILITNDKKIYQVYRNVLSLEEFSVYCFGDNDKRTLNDINKVNPNISKFRGVMFKDFCLDEYVGGTERIITSVNDIISGKIEGAETLDPNYTEYDKNTGEYFDTYNPERLGYLTPTDNSIFLQNLTKDFNYDNK